MDPLAFSVAIVPRGKGRPRTAVRGNHATIYTDGKTRAFEAQMKRVAERVMAGRPPMTGAVNLSIQFRIPVPVSFSKRKRANVLSGVEDYFGAFDTDNMLKACQDAFNGVVFVDDRQVSQALLRRIPHEKPGIDVRVEPFSMQDAA